MLVLFQFLLRLSFGLSAAMAVTNPRLVTSGYYRNNSYVLLGLNVVGMLAAWQARSDSPWIAGVAALAAVLSYLSAVGWLYERSRAGVILLGSIAVVSLVGAWLAAATADGEPGIVLLLRRLDPLTSGLLLGSTTAAMLLGHWYLNAPGMKLEPLQRLIALMGAAVVLRSAVSGVGLVWLLGRDTAPDATQSALLALRWLAGLLGPAIMAWMSWKTLEIPNTQSATGILYVGVIGVFLGEMTAALLSGELVLPL